MKTSILKCLDCGHENESQRVYCHNCGAKLDRSALIEESKKPKQPDKPKINADINGILRAFTKSLLKTAFFAFLAACLIQVARPPLGIPSENQDLVGDIVDAPSLSLELEQAATSRSRLIYSEAQLNAFLKNRVKAPKNPTVPTWVYTYDSVFANLNQGSFRITKKFLILSQPVYLGGTYVPTVSATGIKLTTLSGNLGSLPLPGLVFDLVDEFIFSDLTKNLKEEIKAAGQMQSYALASRTVTISPRSGLKK